MRQSLLPSLTALRTFVCAARHESFTLAADELNLTQSAVSRQVKELELLVGTPLFRRVGRRVILSNAGASFAADLEADLERIRETTARAILAGKSGHALRIATLPTFGERWLIPRLPKFCAAHPQIEISLSTRLAPFDFTHERYNLAIHFGQQNWPDTEMQILCSEEMIAVAAPAALERHSIKLPADLAEAPLLHLQSRPWAWREWLELAGVTRHDDVGGKQFDQFSMIIAAAAAGLGVALLPSYLIESELRSGGLRQIGLQALQSDNAYYAVRPSGDQNELTGKFIEWLSGEAGQSKLP